MKTKQKIWIISFICFGVGVAVLAFGMLLGGCPGFYIDRSGIHTAADSVEEKIIEDSKELEKFSSMEIDVEYADVEVVPSDRFAIEYRISGQKNPVCEVKDGTLTFRHKETGGVYSFNFNVFTPVMGTAADYYVKVYVPEGTEFSFVVIRNEDGDVVMPDVKAASLKIKDEYGAVNIEGFEGETFKAELQDGNLKAENVKADVVDVSNEYGDIEFSKVEGTKMSAKLEEGNFKADMLNFSVTDIQSEYGDVYAGIAEAVEAYDWNLTVEYGNLRIPGYSVSSDSDELKYKVDEQREKKIKIACEDGDIEIVENEK